MNTYTKSILTGLLAAKRDALARLASQRKSAEGLLRGCGTGRMNALYRVAEAEATLDREGAPYTVAGLIGRPPTRSESACYSRELVALEKAGLLERWHWGYSGRATSVRLTPAGEKLAEEISKAGASAS